jgi:membrane protease YdiL (CAAX protease family)
MESVPAKSSTRIALVFECALGLGALGIGWLVGQSPLVGVTFASDEASRQQVMAVGWGLVATGPLLVALWWCERFSSGPLHELSDMTNSVVTRMFGGATAGQMLAVAIAAGWGEELLFRGLVQGGIARLMGDWPGQVAAIAIASVLFGLCHWLNRTYAILAMLAGAYFGVLLVLTGNILAPITAHAAYDFLALVYLLHPDSLLGSE